MRGTSGWHFLATLAVLGAVVVLNIRESNTRSAADVESVVSTEGARKRGNDVRAYLRWRAQHLATDANKDIARLRFPIVNCETGKALSTEAQLDYIHAFVAGENPPASAHCPPNA